MTQKENKYKVNTLAFGAHPDDVEFGCGGLLAKLAKQGKKTAIVDMSLAELSTNGTVENRLIEANEARKVLGATFRENLEIPNNFFFNIRAYQDKLIHALRKYQPDVVLAPYYFDRHPDHENASKLIRDVLFTAGLKRYETELGRHKPIYVLFYMMWNEFVPSITVDITEEFDTKVASILAYKSQFELDAKSIKTIDNEDTTLKYIEARARNYGFPIQRKFGEPYLSINPIGVSDVSNILPNFF